MLEERRMRKKQYRLIAKVFRLDWVEEKENILPECWIGVDSFDRMMMEVFGMLKKKNLYQIFGS